MNNSFLLFHSPKPRSHARNLIYRKWHLRDTEDITCPRVDMNFIFECSTRYLRSERASHNSLFLLLLLINVRIALIWGFLANQSVNQPALYISGVANSNKNFYFKSFISGGSLLC